MLVMPVGNMVLLARELLVGAHVPGWHVVTVLLSTTLYAGAAVAVAANIFGKESVVFADSGSLKMVLLRRFIKPSTHPSIAMSLMLVALLFPAWFFVQGALSPKSPSETVPGVIYGTGVLMPIFFILVPAMIVVYWKVGVSGAFALRLPRARYVLAAIIIGSVTWVISHEMYVLQNMLVQAPAIVVENAVILQQTLAAMPLGHALLLTAIVPAICEELLFRGFLLSGLRSAMAQWPSILLCAAVFGVFHFLFYKFPVTFFLGVILAYLCWQARSVIPAILAHMMHNGIVTLQAVQPSLFEWTGNSRSDEWSHLPVPLVIVSVLVVAGGLRLAGRRKVDGLEIQTQQSYGKEGLSSS
jgi:membrane protease YdiL (CAAX protease family)